MRAGVVSRTSVGAMEITIGVKRAPSILYVMTHVLHVCYVIAARYRGRLSAIATQRRVPVFAFVSHFILG